MSGCLAASRGPALVGVRTNSRVVARAKKGGFGGGFGASKGGGSSSAPKLKKGEGDTWGVSVRRAPGGRWLGLGEVRVQANGDAQRAAAQLAKEIAKGSKKLYPQLSPALLKAGESVEYGVVQGGWLQYADAGDDLVQPVALDGDAGEAQACDFRAAFAAADSPARQADSSREMPSAPKKIGKANPKGFLDM